MDIYIFDQTKLLIWYRYKSDIAPSLHGAALEITLTVPLKKGFKEIFFSHLAPEKPELHKVQSILYPFYHP